MHPLIPTLIVALLLFALAFLAMAIGLMLRGKVMRGGCGSAPSDNGTAVGCEACSKKQLNLCDEDDTTGLAGPAFAATMGRFQKNTAKTHQTQSSPPRHQDHKASC